MAGTYSQCSNNFPADSLFGAGPGDPAPSSAPVPLPAAGRGSLVTRTEAARKRRDRALKRAERPELDEWRAEASDWLRAYLEAHETCFPPGLWDEGMPPLPEGASARAFGAVIRRALQAGWMEPTGEYRRSPSSNLSPKAVYRSLLWSESSAA